MSWIALALIGMVWGQEPAEVGPAPVGVDLRVFVKAAEPALISVIARATGAMLVGTVKVPIKSKEEIEVLDVYSKVSKEEVASTRTFLRWHETEGNDVIDCDANGVTVSYVTQEKTELGLLDGRLVATDLIPRLLRQADAVGFWVGLPGEAAVGQTFPVNVSSLLNLLTEIHDDIAVTSAFTFESIDEQGVAVLRGAVEYDDHMPMDESTSIAAHFLGDMELRVDTHSHALLSLAYDAGATFDGSARGVAIGGEVKLAITASADRGEAAAKAKARKISYRDAVRKAPELDLEFKVPSYWIDAKTVGKIHVFVCGLHADSADGHAQIEIEVFDAPDPKVTVAGAEQKVTSDIPSAKFKALTSKLGKGRSGSFNGDDGSSAIILDVVADRDRVVRLRTINPGKLDKRTIDDLRKLHASLTRSH